MRDIINQHAVNSVVRPTFNVHAQHFQESDTILINALAANSGVKNTIDTHATNSGVRDSFNARATHYGGRWQLYNVRATHYGGIW